MRILNVVYRYFELLEFNDLLIKINQKRYKKLRIKINQKRYKKLVYALFNLSGSSYIPCLLKCPNKTEPWLWVFEEHEKKALQEIFKEIFKKGKYVSSKIDDNERVV